MSDAGTSPERLASVGRAEELQMTEPLELQAPRLCLRRLCPDDAAAVAAYRGLPEVARFQSWASFDAADAVRLIDEQALVLPDTPGTWLQLAIVPAGVGEVIGDCGIHFRSDDPRQVELGVTLSPSYQGRGLAQEALNAVLEYVFGMLGKHRASGVTDADNASAVRLFGRLGFRREAHHVENIWFKGSWGSEFVFALLRREWLKARTERSEAAPKSELEARRP
jgi:RimJ/RimL family protein N-acetyltransferase